MNKDFKKATFNDGDFSIDINISLEEETIWMTQKEIASVFETSPSSINHRLEDIESKNKIASTCIDWESIVLPDGRKYNTKIYNLEIITLLSYKVRSKRAPIFIAWANKTIEELKAKQEREINESYDNVLHCNNYEIVKFKDGDFETNINFDFSHNTIWVSQKQLADIFGVSKMNISLHINNIFEDEELDFSVVKENFTIAQNGKTYHTNFYNLDMVLHIGYRVKSIRGVLFRKWATKILNEYININLQKSDESLTFSELLGAFIKTQNKVDAIDSRVEKIENVVYKDKYLFLNKGQYLEAGYYLNYFFNLESKNIIVIDPYLDDTIFPYLKVVNSKVKWILITSKSNRITKFDIINDNPHYELYINDSFHDRFIIIDDQVVYHLGSSINYLGKNITIISRIDDQKWCDNFLLLVKEVI